MRNVTPAAATVTAPRARQNRLLLLVVVVILVVLLFRACAGHENRYEHIAHQFTQAVQNDDVAAVQSLENTEIAAETPRGRVGSAADRLAPLGTIKSVKEITPPNSPPRVHEFVVQFAKGSVEERYTFDPQDKVFRFDFHAPRTGA